MPYPSLQKLLFVKDYVRLEQQMSRVQKSNSQTTQNLFLETIQIKIQLFKSVKKSQTDRQPLQHFQQNILRLEQNYRHIRNDQVKKLYLLGVGFFVAQLTPKKQTSPNVNMVNQIKNGSNLSRDGINSEEKNLIKQLVNLPSVVQYASDAALMHQIKSSFYLYLTFIELQTKKLIKNKRKQNKDEVYHLLKLIGELSQSYPETIHFVKKIQLILIHLRIYYLNSSIEIVHHEATEQMLNLIAQQYDSKNTLYLNYETIIALLYNALKILLGVDQIPQKLLNVLSIVLKYHNMPIPNNYNQTIFRLFLIIKIIIFRQTQSTKKAISQIKIEANGTKYKQKKRQQEQDDDDFVEVQGQDSILGQTFSNFININLDTSVVELKQVARNIVRHRVASLATIIGFKLGIQNLAIDFLQLMHDSPFNNDIQTIKLCFQLFQARQFSKLEHMFQIVLSASTCKNLKQRQVLIAMCSIFIGVYLQNRQQGLLYAKLNHYESKNMILRPQTLLQHVGFSYFNLAKTQPYLQNRQVYLVKALQNFKKSYSLNPSNYVVTYCMSKVYFRLYDYQMAYKFAMESCKCNRGRWVPFALLACVYMVQRKINKAMIIVEELLKKYPQETLLYYIRAYIQANKILLQVEHDEEVQAAKSMDQQIYQLTKEKVLKSKSLLNLNMYCQQFYNKNRSQVKQIDQNFFNVANNFIIDYHQGQPSYNQTNSQKKALLMSVNLFVEVQQLQTAQGMLRTIPQNQQTSQSKHYHALIHLKRKQYSAALTQYKRILQKDNMHVDSLIQCSLLQSNEPQALNYITLAGKFNNQSKYWFTKGMILSRLYRYQQAHQCFIKQADLAWLEQLPEKLYYY